MARTTGWTLIVLGVHILLYLVYLLWWTGLETRAAQDALLDEFVLEIGDPELATLGEFDGDASDEFDGELGDKYAALWFERDGERIINDEVLLVVQGVDLGSLRSGPGHDPRSDPPGGPGNFVVSGHRTTYSQPFYNLDQIRPGDEIHVVDRNGDKWIYVVDDQGVDDEGEQLGHFIVRPTDVWVIKDGANGPAPTLTLTTCHPRWSAAQRLIVHATLLVEEPVDASDGATESDAA